MLCNRCWKDFEGTPYQAWEKYCFTCQSIRRAEATAKELEKENVELRRNQMPSGGGHWPIEDRSSVAEIENTELREQITVLEAERDAQAAHIAELRAALERALFRAGRDPEDVEYVDTCPHCGDEAVENIDSSEWKFDSHGDMLCRECGGHRGLCGYGTGGRNEISLILEQALATDPPAALERLRREARAGAIEDEADKWTHRTPDNLDWITADRPWHCDERKECVKCDLLNAAAELRAQGGEG